MAYPATRELRTVHAGLIGICRIHLGHIRRRAGHIPNMDRRWRRRLRSVDGLDAVTLTALLVVGDIGDRSWGAALVVLTG